jgi:hypothetical protein
MKLNVTSISTVSEVEEELLKAGFPAEICGILRGEKTYATV